MECAVCGADDELIYPCGRCETYLCATHHGRRYHDCAPKTPRTTGAPTFGGDPEPTVDRPEAQVFPDRVGADDPDVQDTAGAAGPDGSRPAPVGKPRTLTEWLRRQTYVTLTVKVGLLAAFWNLLFYSTMVAAAVMTVG